EKRVFLVILFTSFSGSLVSRIPGAVQSSMTIKHHCLRNGVFVFICFILEADALAVKQRR
ncbi:hypothetical protein ACYUT7_20615, partial [Escherichia coli]